jgi:hypothetical protein
MLDFDHEAMIAHAGAVFALIAPLCGAVGRQACAETYPGAGWPEQAQRTLRGVIRAWHAAREQGPLSIGVNSQGKSARLGRARYFKK